MPLEYPVTEFHAMAVVSRARPMVKSGLMHPALQRCFYGLLLLTLVLAHPTQATPLTCAQILVLQPGRGQLLGVVVGGRATGAHIPKVARQLGFRLVHIYPEGLPASIISSFGTADYDYPAIEYRTGDLASVEAQVRALSERERLPVAGFVAGMDYGAGAADWLSEAFGKPTNGREHMEMRNDKDLFNAHLQARGVPVARSVLLRPEEALARAPFLTYPLYIKAPRGFASIGSAPAMDAASFPAALAKVREEAGQMKISTEEVFVQEFQHPNTIYFVDTAHATIAGVTHRITTGVWIDHRGDDYPKHIWDFIEMLPPPALLEAPERQLFHWLVESNSRMAEAGLFHSGTSHTEYMAPFDRPRFLDDLKPTDVNPRLPGLRASQLEERSTGVDPFVLDILSRTHPEYLLGMPTLYSQWKENVALIFLRSHYDGKITASGRAWLEARRTPRGGQAYITDILVAPPGSPAAATINGASMTGTLHVAGPTRESIRALLREVREKERAGFFVEPL